MATYSGQPQHKLKKFHVRASYSAQTIVNYVVSSAIPDEEIWLLDKAMIVAQSGTVNGWGILADYGADIVDPNNPGTNGVVGIVEKFGYGNIPSVPANSAEVNLVESDLGYRLDTLGSAQNTQNIYTLTDENKGFRIHGNAKVTIAMDIQDNAGDLNVDFIDAHVWFRCFEYSSFEEGTSTLP